MFKLPNRVPLISTAVEDWADYAEYTAIKTKADVSVRNLVKPGQLVSDEVQIAGADDESDEFNTKMDEIIAQIRFRETLLNGRYPYSLANHDYTIRYNNTPTNFDLIYRFLLLSTRLNMTDEKVQGGIDGTQTFEKLCGTVAQNYFGELANVDVFGTSKSNVGGFRTKLEDVVRRLGEGGALHANANFRPQDDKIDIIVWKGFNDRMPSQVIGFGQCKTGTSWQNKLTELNPITFNKKWFTRQPIVEPIKIFFCAQYFPTDVWYERGVDAGLIFDRFRIMEFLPEDIDADVLEEIRTWTTAAEGRFSN